MGRLTANCMLARSGSKERNPMSNLKLPYEEEQNEEADDKTASMPGVLKQINMWPNSTTNICTILY